jgi:hypothetical protein
MSLIKPETKRKMLQAWGIGMAAFIAPASVAYRTSILAAIETIVVLPLFLAAFPAIMQFSLNRGARNAKARARRLEEYRASPESHLLHLNDVS